MNAELKLCPFCGSEAYFMDRTIESGDSDDSYVHQGWFEVGCTQCESVRCQGNPSSVPIDDWNRRADDTAQRQVAGLSAALQTMLSSAHPNPKDHPAMAKAWEIGKAALSGAEQANAKEEHPKCAHCGKPATCIGAYEGAEKESYACDDCCAHGNEDGHCNWVASDKEIVDWLDWYVQNDDRIEIEEEDGGVIVWVFNNGTPNSYVGKDVREALAQARRCHAEAAQEGGLSK